MANVFRPADLSELPKALRDDYFVLSTLKAGNYVNERRVPNGTKIMRSAAAVAKRGYGRLVYNSRREFSIQLLTADEQELGDLIHTLYEESCNLHAQHLAETWRSSEDIALAAAAVRELWIYAHTIWEEASYTLDGIALVQPQAELRPLLDKIADMQDAVDAALVANDRYEAFHRLFPIYSSNRRAA